MLLYAQSSCAWVLVWPGALFLSGCTFFYAHKKGEDLGNLLNVSRVKSVWQQFFDSDQKPVHEMSERPLAASGKAREHLGPAVARPASGII